MNKMPRKVR